VLDICATVVAVPLPRYREPRWSTLAPPEAGEFDAPLMRRVLRDISAEYQIALRQVEYTHMAPYGGDILVEHDVTFDLYGQVLHANRTLSARWDFSRWRRFERRAVERFRRVVVMSDKDAELLGAPHAGVIPNGVDRDRFQPQPERPNLRMLFVGSFRHFPNLEAFRFFVEEVWPLVVRDIPGATAAVIAGPDPDRYWSGEVPDGVVLHGFISDVRPFYAEANVVVVPTKVSAGTNLKVLEAMAMERAIVSTTSGCAGIGLEHRRDAWIADDAEGFARGVVTLLNNAALRREYALAARTVVQRYDWRAIGAVQKKLWLSMLGSQPVHIRVGTPRDLQRITDIQVVSHLGANWDPATYLAYDLKVAEKRGQLAGFLVSRDVGGGEIEVLNLAVDPAFRREGIATALMESVPAEHVFLEVRESNARAIALYEKLGFTEVGRRADYYDDPAENAIVMRRSRPPAY
jgi:ribosomal-protein-alanine acetyltransferase